MSSPAVAALSASFSDYLELTKPRITLMVTLTALLGFAMASPGPFVANLSLLGALLGTALTAGAASALNMLLERDVDARMRRTRTRPLPAGRLQPLDALRFGLALSAVGFATLVTLAGPLATAVAFATWSSYLFVYTPLKRLTSLSTVVGAVPGALPPLIGWAAARGTLDPGAFVLFAILFLWQIPHFLAIAWIYREDYAAGGLPMLPVLDPEGRITGRQAVANTVALVVVSLAPGVAGMAGPLYVGGALLLGAGLGAVAARAAILRTPAGARALFVGSVLYLPLLSVLLFVTRA